MYEDFIPVRLAKLRILKGVSAREMSADIGQNENYINLIENRKSMPSMQGFFYICEYLDISPKEFFDDGKENPKELNELFEDITKLSQNQVNIIHTLVKDMKK